MKTSIILATVLFILFSSCKEDNNQTAAVEAPIVKTADDMVQLSAAQIKNAGIVMGVSEKKEMHTILKVNGEIIVPPKNIISISMPMGGYLKSTHLMAGAKVNKGSLLAVMEDQQYIQLQQDYLSAQIRLEYLTGDYKRQQSLNETKAVSDKIFQQAKADFNEQKILVRSLAEKLRLLGIHPEHLDEKNISRTVNLYAPITGYVTKVNTNIGRYADPSDVLFELINPDDLHIRLTVFENDASKLAVGQKITYSINVKPDEIYTATITLITPSINENRATDVYCRLAGDHKSLFPGTFINASVALNNAQVTAVPEDAIVKWNNKRYLFREESENNFRLLPVETGVSNKGYIEITSKLPVNNIVIKNAYTILMKMKNSAEEE